MCNPGGLGMTDDLNCRSCQIGQVTRHRLRRRVRLAGRLTAFSTRSPLHRLPYFLYHGSTTRREEVCTKVSSSQVRGDWGETPAYQRSHGHALVLDAGAPLHP